MADSKKADAKKSDAPDVNPDGTPKAPTATEAAEAAGRAPQEMEKAEASGDASKIEAASRSEAPPTPDPDTDKKPTADANPTEALGESDSGPNQMSTAGLNPIQTARVEGTPIDGTNGAMFVQNNPEVGEQPREKAARSRSR